jgi:RNA polymerase sigma-70 factor (sigma-E family)
VETRENALAAATGVAALTDGLCMDREQEAEFETFVTACWGRLVGVAFLLTGDRGDAEDLVQTALATCYRHWPRIVAGGREEAYVRASVVNAHISSARRRRLREIVTFQLPERADDGAVDASDDRDLLRRALRRLPPRTRAAVVLRHYTQLSETEAASVMSCSVGNIKRLTFQGLRQLREHLGAPDPRTGRGTVTPAQRGAR